ncbi:MAG: hypothetical protein ACXVY8_07170 [Gaiellaceae bacterium]
MLASIWTFLIPVWILLFLAVLMGVVAILSRVRQGRYLRPVITGMSKVPLLRRGLQRLSNAAIKRQNPALASAMKKMERAGAMRDPQRVQAAMSRLTAQERKAWLEVAEQQGTVPEGANRQMRRQLKNPGKGPQQRYRTR